MLLKSADVSFDTPDLELVEDPGYLECSGVRIRAGIDKFFSRRLPVWKRAADIVGAVACLVLFSPIFVGIALLIKMVSPGHIFFSQERIGFGGRPFRFYKFRTMKSNSDTREHQKHLYTLISGGNYQGCDNPMEKLDDHNPNIIPFGRFLRKSCLDELPQLFNVLLGDMSLVGPRPPIPYEVYVYQQWHNGRFDTVPGMTGLWQVSGKNRLSFKEMVRLDIRYTQRLSFLSDLQILAKTPFAIAGQFKSGLAPLNFLKRGAVK